MRAYLILTAVFVFGLLANETWAQDTTTSSAPRVYNSTQPIYNSRTTNSGARPIYNANPASNYSSYTAQPLSIQQLLRQGKQKANSRYSSSRNFSQDLAFDPYGTKKPNPNFNGSIDPNTLATLQEQRAEEARRSRERYEREYMNQQYATGSTPSRFNARSNFSSDSTIRQKRDAYLRRFQKGAPRTAALDLPSSQNRTSAQNNRVRNERKLVYKGRPKGVEQPRRIFNTVH